MATKIDKPNAIRVTSRSPRGTFWRANRQWTTDPTTVPLGELTAAQLTAVRDEPMLVVEDVVLQPAEAGATA